MNKSFFIKILKSISQAKNLAVNFCVFIYTFSIFSCFNNETSLEQGSDKKNNGSKDVLENNNQPTKYTVPKTSIVTNSNLSEENKDKLIKSGLNFDALSEESIEFITSNSDFLNLILKLHPNACKNLKDLHIKKIMRDPRSREKIEFISSSKASLSGSELIFKLNSLISVLSSEGYEPYIDKILNFKNSKPKLFNKWQEVICAMGLSGENYRRCFKAIGNIEILNFLNEKALRYFLSLNTNFLLDFFEIEMQKKTNNIFVRLAEICGDENELDENFIKYFLELCTPERNEEYEKVKNVIMTSPDITADKLNMLGAIQKEVHKNEQSEENYQNKNNYLLASTIIINERLRNSHILSHDFKGKEKDIVERLNSGINFEGLSEESLLKQKLEENKTEENKTEDQRMLSLRSKISPELSRQFDKSVITKVFKLSINEIIIDLLALTEDDLRKFYGCGKLFPIEDINAVENLSDILLSDKFKTSITKILALKLKNKEYYNCWIVTIWSFADDSTFNINLLQRFLDDINNIENFTCLDSDSLRTLIAKYDSSEFAKNELNREHGNIFIKLNEICGSTYKIGSYLTNCIVEMLCDRTLRANEYEEFKELLDKKASIINVDTLKSLDVCEWRIHHADKGDSLEETLNRELERYLIKSESGSIIRKRNFLSTIILKNEVLLDLICMSSHDKTHVLSEFLKYNHVVDQLIKTEDSFFIESIKRALDLGVHSYTNLFQDSKHFDDILYALKKLYDKNISDKAFEWFIKKLIEKLELDPNFLIRNFIDSELVEYDNRDENFYELPKRKPL